VSKGVGGSRGPQGVREGVELSLTVESKEPVGVGACNALRGGEIRCSSQTTADSSTDVPFQRSKRKGFGRSHSGGPWFEEELTPLLNHSQRISTRGKPLQCNREKKHATFRDIMYQRPHEEGTN